MNGSHDSINSESNLPWMVVLAQSILCIVLVTYCITLSISNVNYIKTTSESESKFTQLIPDKSDNQENDTVEFQNEKSELFRKANLI